MLGFDGQQPAGHSNDKYCGNTKKEKKLQRVTRKTFRRKNYFT